MDSSPSHKAFQEIHRPHFHLGFPPCLPHALVSYSRAISGDPTIVNPALSNYSLGKSIHAAVVGASACVRNSPSLGLTLLGPRSLSDLGVVQGPRRGGLLYPLDEGADEVLVLAFQEVAAT